MYTLVIEELKDQSSDFIEIRNQELECQIEYYKELYLNSTKNAVQQKNLLESGEKQRFLDNIEIINQEVGGIYEAIMLYENTFGEFDQAKDMTRPIFYARLAFISLYEIVSQKVLTQQDNHTD